MRLVGLQKSAAAGDEATCVYQKQHLRHDDSGHDGGMLLCEQRNQTREYDRSASRKHRAALKFARFVVMAVTTAVAHGAGLRLLCTILRLP